MSINNMIAEASAPHMKAIGTALDALGAAVRSATAAGFTASLQFPAETAEGPKNPLHDHARFMALEALTTPGVNPVLEFRATVMERAPG